MRVCEIIGGKMSGNTLLSLYKEGVIIIVVEHLLPLSLF